MTCEEVQELIGALVDDELPQAERSLAQGHLGQCPKCRLIYEEERAVKEGIRAAAASVIAPAELRKQIEARMRLFGNAEQSRKGLARPAARAFRPAFAFALIALLILPAALYLAGPTKPVLSLSALRAHDEVLAGTIPVNRGKRPQELSEELIRAVEGRFAPMGYDLSTISLKPVGGFMREFGGRKTLVVLYEGQGAALTCHTFLGTEKDAPKEARAFFDPEKKVHFYIFSRGEITGILHREGKVICILVAKMPADELLALARSKARAAGHF